MSLRRPGDPYLVRVNDKVYALREAVVNRHCRECKELAPIGITKEGKEIARKVDGHWLALGLSGNWVTAVDQNEYERMRPIEFAIDPVRLRDEGLFSHGRPRGLRKKR